MSICIRTYVGGTWVEGCARGVDALAEFHAKVWRQSQNTLFPTYVCLGHHFYGGGGGEGITPPPKKG